MNKKEYNEIFLAVIGITPQVLTECIYYFYSDYYKQNRKFDRIKVFTTLQGQKQLTDRLFTDGQLKNLEKALALKTGDIPFTKNDIMLFTDKNGEPINDIRTTEDNEESLRILHDELKRWTSDNTTRVTATVAGGRKTMSTQMALAFQLYARDHDELVHIIAPDEKMDPRNPESQTWFFPVKPEDPSEQLDVSHIPVLRVGRYLSTNLELPPAELIEQLQSELIKQAPIDELTVVGKSFNSGDEKLIPSPLLASYLRYFIKVRKNSSCDRSCSGCIECFVKNSDLPELATGDILADHKTLFSSNSGHFEKTKDAREAADIFELRDLVKSDISRLKRAIRTAAITNRFKSSIQVKTLELEPGNRQLKWHGVALDPQIITIEK